MVQITQRSFGAMIIFLLFLIHDQEPSEKENRGTVLLEVVRHSWDVEREETLVYLRVYSSGLAEAHPMKEVDFRNIEFKKKQLSDQELTSLHNLLTDPATASLEPKYSRNWGNKDFGYKFDVTVSENSTKKLLELDNFQPFLARKQGKPYPKQLEKIGCSIWKLRLEVTAEPLEKNWLKGCAELGY
jgi:hypothetical protein